MPTKDNIYPNLGYWFLSLIVLVFAGFYYTYFTILFIPRPIIIHIHFALLMLWIAMLIVQPFLIKYKKKPLHRTIGKLSYVLVPLVLLSCIMVMRLEYYTQIDAFHAQAAKGIVIPESEILRRTSNNPNAIFFFLWFAVFYALAIANRRKSSVHSRYMLATAFAMLGPTLDRILIVNLHHRTFAGNIPSLVVTFLITDIVLAFLMYKDYKASKPMKTLATCLAIYVVGQSLYLIVPHLNWWGKFYAMLMKPVP